MNTLGIECDSWVAWIAIGLVGGIICSLIYGGRRLLAFDIILGIAGSVIGGFGSAVALGDNSRQTFIVSVLTALFLAAATLWVFNMLATSRRPPRNNSD